jgi:hypothetical protein
MDTKYLLKKILQRTLRELFGRIVALELMFSLLFGLNLQEKIHQNLYPRIMKKFHPPQ